MKNKYVDFISDEHFLDCVANLHKAYLKAKNNITKKHFYSNKVDTIKLTFDALDIINALFSKTKYMVTP